MQPQDIHPSVHLHLAETSEIYAIYALCQVFYNGGLREIMQWNALNMLYLVHTFLLWPYIYGLIGEDAVTLPAHRT